MCVCVLCTFCVRSACMYLKGAGTGRDRAGVGVGMGWIPPRVWLEKVTFFCLFGGVVVMWCGVV